MLPTIAVVNASKAMTDAEVAKAVAALQKQVSVDFAPHYSDAHLVVSKAIPAGAWGLVILDNSDQAGALGYHDLTKSGLPLGKVFAGSDKADGMSPSVTMSHELLEMLADPWINLCAEGPGGRFYAYEVCDAVEADELGYKIDDVLVSDFVLPNWFEPGMTKGPFALKSKVKRPFALLPGGYIGVNVGGKWTQITAENTPKKFSQRARLGSRRERRSVGKDHWHLSKV